MWLGEERALREWEPSGFQHVVRLAHHLLRADGEEPGGLGYPSMKQFAEEFRVHPPPQAPLPVLPAQNSGDRQLRGAVLPQQRVDLLVPELDKVFFSGTRGVAGIWSEPREGKESRARALAQASHEIDADRDHTPSRFHLILPRHQFFSLSLSLSLSPCPRASWRPTRGGPFPLLRGGAPPQRWEGPP